MSSSGRPPHNPEVVDIEAIKKDDAGVIWLGKPAGESSDLQQPTLPMPGLFEGKANAGTQ